jgi:dTDP-4-amino-4,6-dideoxygalactose transaminase
MPYKVPFVNYKKQYSILKKELDPAIREILQNGDFILRDHLRKFEQQMAGFIGVKYTIGLNSGTDALFLSLLAAGIGPGDEVITVAHTFLATVGAIVNNGGTPVLVDVKNDFNIDIDQLEKVITKKTKAIIPVHLNGRLCDMDKVMKIAAKHKLLVIEDSAQALGATFNKKMGGSIGLTGCFSFYPAKVLGTAGDGGMVSTNDKAVADKVRALRDNGRVMGKDEVISYGYNSRLDNLHAAILSVKLKHLPDWIKRRREVAAMYYNGMQNISGLEQMPPPTTKGPYYDVFQNYVIRTKKRDKLVSFLREKGIEILISWPIPMNKQKALKLSKFKLPETESISREVLSLPMYPEISNSQVEYTINTVRRFFK